MTIKDCILNLIQAQNPVTIKEIVSEIKLQTDLFDGTTYSAIDRELLIEYALNELIQYEDICITVTIENSNNINIGFDLL